MLTKFAENSCNRPVKNHEILRDFNFQQLGLVLTPATLWRRHNQSDALVF